MKKLTPEEIESALDACAAEPIHIPGIVQPFACLVAIDPKTRRIEYVSENVENILGLKAVDLLGSDLREKLGKHIWHDIKNAMALGGLDETPVSLGQQTINNGTFDARVFANANHVMLEAEPVADAEFSGQENIAAFSSLLLRVQSCEDLDALFDLSVDLLRHLTGYDRVALYRFDSNWNGKVIAEAKLRSLPTWMGVWFPSHDIPEQARELMRRLSYRFIPDIDLDPVPILALPETSEALDISLAVSRGVSPIHMQYLRNMGVKATMTLSIVFEGKLWGAVTLHHGEARVPSSALRDVLTNWLPLFCTKVQALTKAQDYDNIVKISENAIRISEINENVLDSADQKDEAEDGVQLFASVAIETLSAIGIAVISDIENRVFEVVPESEVIEAIQASVDVEQEGIMTFDRLADQFPELSDKLNGCAGAIVARIDSDRYFMAFRKETVTDIHWAGKPDKTIERIDGNLRLQPRGSFQTFVQLNKGSCLPWTENDIYYAQRFIPIIKSAERRTLRTSLQRQQTLMIGELNHRVRNILALVRSVSRQAGRSYGSLQSYSKALEARIQALAAAHDLSSSSFVVSVGVSTVIRQELKPYAGENFERLILRGEEGYLGAESAPFLSLVIHELATNCAKYGSLSSAKGVVEIDLQSTEAGLWIKWTEKGGPKVPEPKTRGFGSALIEQAAAHEFDGESKLEFDPDGVRASLFLPSARLRSAPPKDTSPVLPTSLVTKTFPFDASSLEGYVLIVEDNYVVARDAADIIESLGFASTETCSNVKSAYRLIDAETPVFAMLDVNLGRGETSEAIAQRLQDLNVPFVFLTGYGENPLVSKQSSNVPLVQKPLMTMDLEIELHRLFPEIMRSATAARRKSSSGG